MAIRPSPAAASAAAPAAATQPPDEAVVQVPPGGPVRIALVAALSGENAAFGIDERRAAELAVTEVGEIRGLPIELVVRDGGCAAAAGETAARALVADPAVVGVVGHTCSASSIAAAPVYAAAEYPMISPSSTAPGLTSEGWSIANRVIWNDVVQAEAAAEFARSDLATTTAAALHDGTPWGIALALAFREGYEAAGGRLIAFDEAPGDPTALRSVLSRVAASRPEAIYYAGFPATAGAVKAALPEVGLQETPFLGPDPLREPAYQQAAGPQAANTYATSVEPDLTEAALAARPVFDQLYLARYGEQPAQAGPYHYHAYDATKLLLERIAEVALGDASTGLTIDRRALAEAIRATTAYPGLTGLMTCDPAGDCGTARVIVSAFENGQWRPVRP